MGLLSVRIETSDGTSLMIKEAGGVSVWLCAGIVVRDDSLKVWLGQGHCVTINQDTGFRAGDGGDGLLSRYHAIIMHHIQTSRFLDMIIWLPVALLSCVELQQVGAAVVVAGVVAAVGHRNLNRTEW